MTLLADLRRSTYLALHAVRGSEMPRLYRSYLAMDHVRTYPTPAEMLGPLLEHAVTTVPHYSGRVDVGEIHEDPLGALGSFPVLSKADIRDAGADLLSSHGDRDGWQRNTSGGSTGEPVVLWQDRGHQDRAVAIRNVYSTWAGGRLGAPELYIWGSEQDLLQGREQLSNRIGNRLLDRTLLNAFLLTDERMREIVEDLQRRPPGLVLAYAQAAYEVAVHATREGLAIPPQSGMIATAGTLHAFMRERLEEFFGCPVLDRYGSREAGDMAGECSEQDGLHVLPWSCYLEVLDPDGKPAAPGETGEIVITSYTNRAMPLIRYAIGDLGVVADPERSCPCGRQTQMLDGVTGRTVDVFIGADGRRVDGEYFTHLLYFRPWLRQFQVVQASPEEVVYRLVADEPVPEGDEIEIREKTRAALGDGCQVRFEAVDEIEPLSSGKRSYTLRAF